MTEAPMSVASSRNSGEIETASLPGEFIAMNLFFVEDLSSPDQRHYDRASLRTHGEIQLTVFFDSTFHRRKRHSNARDCANTILRHRIFFEIALASDASEDGFFSGHRLHEDRVNFHVNDAESLAMRHWSIGLENSEAYRYLFLLMMSNGIFASA